ncbi:MAG: N-acetylmuramoyl-L-alanine amidase [Erysipelotrichaceae bacterium]|nr:N-acetylmuramoyl-L-alanine amidase [Erysipelotrichaceae bacterium]
MKRKRKKNNFLRRIICGLLLAVIAMYSIAEYGIPYINEQFLIHPVQPEVIDGLVVHTKFIEEGRQNRPGIKRTIKYIVIHETGNFKAGATAENHSIYLTKNSKVENSWHYTVDDTEIWHHLPDDEVGWHASDGLSNPGGNLNGIGIELCVNKDGDFEKTLDNAAKLVAYLLSEYNLPLSRVKQHHDFTKKNCPQTIRNTDRWEEFLQMVKTYKNGKD